MVERKFAVAEDRGGFLSNLIGIVLIVGITVVLVSFAAIFLTGLRDEVDEPPETPSSSTSGTSASRAAGPWARGTTST